MHKLFCALTLILTLIGSSFAIAQPGMPVGVGGIIEIDNIPIGGITVQVENLNTGEYKTTTTAYDTPYTKCGYYTVALSGQNGDIIKVTVTYGNTYSNTTTVDLGLVTQFCNISISTEEPYDPPDDPPYNPPDGGNGDEPEEPPENNETEEPPENDTDDDICNLYNLTVEVTDNTTGDPISNASVTIYDNNETKITKSYTNESGEATFLLEEGTYIIEVEKDKHSSSYHTVSLLASMEYTAYMSAQNDGNSTNPMQQDDEQSFPVVYVGIAGVVTAIVAVSFFFYYKNSRIKK